MHDLQSNFGHNVETNLVTTKNTYIGGEIKFWFLRNTLLTHWWHHYFYMGWKHRARASLSLLRKSWKCPKTFSYKVSPSQETNIIYCPSRDVIASHWDHGHRKGCSIYAWVSKKSLSLTSFTHRGSKYAHIFLNKFKSPKYIRLYTMPSLWSYLTMLSMVFYQRNPWMNFSRIHTVHSQLYQSSWTSRVTTHFHIYYVKIL